MSNLAFFLSLCIVLLQCIFSSDAHLLLREPACRGGLGGQRSQPWRTDIIDSRAVEDMQLHFPSGDKSLAPGAGFASQIQAAGNRPWAPFEPMRNSYTWRHGVCGDTVNGNAHLRGGRYYFNGQIAATYSAGQDITIESTVVFHHGGFLVFHVCDVSRCPGNEISEQCFKTAGACHKLYRVADAECDNGGGSARCTPIDRNFPERWYLPCSRKRNGYEVYTNIKYRLPAGVRCDHCVLHQHYETADRCTPNGYTEYFNGPDAPGANNGCTVRGFPVDGVSGLFDPESTRCGGRRYTEDYAHCADIRIEPGTGNDNRNPSVPAPPRPSKSPSPRPRNTQIRIKSVALAINGMITMYIQGKTPCIYLKKGRSAAFKVQTSGNVEKVTFRINGRVRGTDSRAPFFLSNNISGRPNWSGFSSYIGRKIRLEVFASNSRTGASNKVEYNFWILQK